MELLQIGAQAPELGIEDQNGKVHHLADYKGKKVVLYFYPKDDTPGCTKEACDFRDHHTELVERGFVVIGVSADTAAKHVKFIGKYDLPFPLLADTEKKVIQAYGAWGRKKFMGREYDGIFRVTYVIDEQGLVERVFDKVQTATPTAQILATYE